MRSAFTGLLLVLAGCAYSPADIKRTGERVDFYVERKPQPLALCAQRTAENQTGLISTRLTELKGGGYELVIRTDDLGALAVLEITSNLTGSWVGGYVHMNPQPSAEAIARGFLAGC